MAGVVVGGPGDDLHVGRRDGGRPRQRDGLLDVEALADEHRTEAELLRVVDLLDEVAGVLRAAGERVEAQFGM